MTLTPQRDTLAAALPREIERVAKLIPQYRAVEMGFIAAGMMQRSLDAAQAAIASADLVGMIRAYEDLKGYSL